MTEVKESQVTLLATEALEEIIGDVLYDHFSAVRKSGLEVSGDRSREEFIESQMLVKAMYIIVQIVLEDILPEIEIRPRWMAPRRTS